MKYLKYIPVYTFMCYNKQYMHILLKICQAFKKHKVEYAIVGGYAVALHGVFRGTHDIDFIIKHAQKQFEAVEKALNEIGFLSRLPVKANDVFHFREEYIKNRNLIAWSFYNPRNPLEVVDIVITHDLSQMKRDSLNFLKQKIYIVSKSDLIKMKLDSGRPQDMDDVKKLKDVK